MLFERVDYFTISIKCLPCDGPVAAARVRTRVAGERPLVATLCRDCAILEIQTKCASEGVPN